MFLAWFWLYSEFTGFIFIANNLVSRKKQIEILLIFLLTFQQSEIDFLISKNILRIFKNSKVVIFRLIVDNFLSIFLEMAIYLNPIPYSAHVSD